MCVRVWPQESSVWLFWSWRQLARKLIMTSSYYVISESPLWPKTCPLFLFLHLQDRSQNWHHLYNQQVGNWRKCWNHGILGSCHFHKWANTFILSPQEETPFWVSWWWLSSFQYVQNQYPSKYTSDSEPMNCNFENLGQVCEFWNDIMRRGLWDLHIFKDPKCSLIWDFGLKVVLGNGEVNFHSKMAQFISINLRSNQDWKDSCWIPAGPEPQVLWFRL